MADEEHLHEHPNSRRFLEMEVDDDDDDDDVISLVGFFETEDDEDEDHDDDDDDDDGGVRSEDLCIWVYSASNIPQRNDGEDTFSYVRLCFSSGLQIRRTQTILNDSNPIFKSTLSFNISNLTYRRLVEQNVGFEVVCNAPGGYSNFIGTLYFRELGDRLMYGWPFSVNLECYRHGFTPVLIHFRMSHFSPVTLRLFREDGVDDDVDPVVDDIPHMEAPEVILIGLFDSEESESEVDGSEDDDDVDGSEDDDDVDGSEDDDDVVDELQAMQIGEERDEELEGMGTPGAAAGEEDATKTP